jgi:CxxC-x17-CxxC domain-containing protein
MLRAVCFGGPLNGLGSPRGACSPVPPPRRADETGQPIFLEWGALNYADKTLTCRDCGRDFTFTAGEQEFYASRGFTNEPGRCPDCRAAYKAARGGSGSYGSGTYTSGGYSTGGYSSGGYSTGGYDRGERQMYSVTCSNCGNEARVPFQPRGDKPVYCSDCFSKQRGGESGGYSRSYR